MQHKFYLIIDKNVSELKATNMFMNWVKDVSEFLDWCNKIKSNINTFKKGKEDIVKKHARFPTSFLCRGIK